MYSLPCCFFLLITAIQAQIKNNALQHNGFPHLLASGNLLCSRLKTTVQKAGTAKEGLRCHILFFSLTHKQWTVQDPMYTTFELCQDAFVKSGNHFALFCVLPLTVTDVSVTSDVIRSSQRAHVAQQQLISPFKLMYITKLIAKQRLFISIALTNLTCVYKRC